VRVFLVVLPFVFGYFLTGRVLRESRLLMRLSMAYALGLTFFLALVNAAFYVTGLRVATYVAIGVLAGASLSFLWLNPVRGRMERLTRLDAAVLTAMAVTVVITTLLWQMQQVDDDIWIHGPLMGAYLNNNFPPRNPYFPEFPYRGHYGRDLTIAAFSTLAGGRFLEVQSVLTVLNHLVTLVLGYLVWRRFVRIGRAALLATLFGFLAVNNATRNGLLETFQNNNTFAYLLLFANMYLVLAVLERRGVWRIIVSAVSLGTYALVYETHFGALLIGIVGMACCYTVWQPRRRLPSMKATAAMLAGALVLSAVEGGAVTDALKSRMLSSHSSVATTEDFRGVSQEVSIRFPKPGLRITAPTGDEYGVFSLRFVREAGLFVPLLPFTMGMMLWRRSLLGSMIGITAVVSLLVPAAVDFGRFNPESVRFLMLGGTLAAMLFGAGAAWWLQREARLGPSRKNIAIGLVVVILALSSSKSLWLVVRQLERAAGHPTEFYLSGAEWACGSRRSQWCDRVDVAASERLHTIALPGETLVSDSYLDQGNPRFRDSVLGMFSGVYVVGHGIRVYKDKVYSWQPYFIPAGFRTVAFWHTLEPRFLEDIRPTYLFLNPENLLPESYARLQARAEVVRVFRDKDPQDGRTREVYRFLWRPSEAVPSPPADLSIRTLSFPERIERARFYWIRIALGTDDSLFHGPVRISYRTYYRDIRMDPGDEIRQTINVGSSPNSGLDGELAFVAPYDPGDYRLEFLVWAGDSPSLLKTSRGEPDTVRIHVD